MTAMTLHTIAEVCDLTGMHKLSANPEQWITRQIVAGRFKARRIGRQWAMTDADIQHMLERLANAEQESRPESKPVVGLPSMASRRRRVGVA
jgi:hypothetical protein